MNQDEAFLQAIRAEPDDDTPRLVYADWLDEHGGAPERARAEFIRVQCRVRHLNRNDPVRAALKDREEQLLAEHCRDWIEPIVEAMREERWRRRFLERFEPEYCFERGFVEYLRLDAEVFLDRAGAITRLTPLRRLSLRGAGSRMAEVAASPFLDDLTQLLFNDYFSDPLDAAGARALAGSPHLTRLTILDLTRNNIGDAGLIALAAAPWMATVTSLYLSDNGLSADGVIALTRSPHRPELGSLDLGVNWPGALGIDALATAPNLAGIVSLDLNHCDLTDADVGPLFKWPGLNAETLFGLNLRGNRLSATMRQTFEARLGSLVFF